MKSLVIMLILLQGCSTWKQKDFKKEMEKSHHPEVIVEIDEKLREKFEVQPARVEEPVIEVPKIRKPKKALPKTKVKPKSSKEVVAPEIVKIQEVKTMIPKDYPPETLALNKRAKIIWDKYVPNHRVDEKLYMDIHYLGMTVGKIMITNKGKKTINNQEVWHFHARFKSAPFYSNIYELDDTIDTYVTTDNFLSTRYSLIQRESKQAIDDLQLHDRDQLKTFWFYKKKKPDGSIKDKHLESFIPYYSTDPFSILFFYQGLPLNDGDVFEIPIVNKTKIMVLKSEVEGREVISTDEGNRKAIRVHATTKYSGEHLKSGDMYFWFSDDEKRTLLKARAKIKIGSVTAEIVEG